MQSPRTIIISYLQDLSETKTGKRLGLSRDDVRNTIVGNQELLRELQDARNMRLQVDSDWVLVELLKMYNSKLTDICDEDGRVKPIKDWGGVWVTMVSSFEHKDIVGREGDVIGKACKINKPDALKLLELIGKHTNISAFKESGEQDVKANEMVEKMKEGRKRVFDKNVIELKASQNEK